MVVELHFDEQQYSRVSAFQLVTLLRSRSPAI